MMPKPEYTPEFRELLVKLDKEGQGIAALASKPRVERLMREYGTRACHKVRYKANHTLWQAKHKVSLKSERGQGGDLRRENPDLLIQRQKEFDT
jgi:hypothetical protein